MSAAPKLDAPAAEVLAALARGYAAAANLHDISERRFCRSAEVKDDRAEVLNAAARRFGIVSAFALPLPEMGRVVLVGADGGVSVWPMLARPDDAGVTVVAPPSAASADREEFRQPESGREVRLSTAAVQDWIERNILYTGDDIREGRALAPFSAGCCMWVPLTDDIREDRPPVGAEFVALVQADVLEMELAEVMPDGRIETMTGAPAVAWLRGLVIPEGKTL